MMVRGDRDEREGEEVTINGVYEQDIDYMNNCIDT